MPPKSSLRAVLVAACLVIVVGAYAGASAGSGSSPRATAPKLLAHDVSGFGRVVRHAKPGPALWRRSAHASLPVRIFNDSVLADSHVLNPAGDISKTQLLYGYNGSYQVLSRVGGGATLGGISNVNFWSGLAGPDAAGLCATHPQGEPSIAYDWSADRWVISEAAYAVSGSTPTGAYVQCVAVSTSPDATGTWSRYVFQVSTSLYADRPTLGIWSDGYYLSFNQLTSNGTWAGAGALALERSKMLTGASAQARYFDLGNVTPGLGGMLPANLSGSNAPAGGANELYVQGHDDPSNIHDRLEIWGFHVDWTAPVSGSTFQPVTNIDLDSGSTYRSTFSCTQPGTSTTWTACLAGKPSSGSTAIPLEPLSVAYSDTTDALPQLGGRLQWARSSGGNETLTVTETQDASGGYATPAWFKLSNIGGAGWNIAARGTYDPGDNTSRFLPSAGFDNSGNVGLAFVTTDGTHDPTTAYTNASDGTFVETTIDTATVPFTGGRIYGGQTTLALDPVDLCTFWFVGPMPQSGTVSIGDFSFPSCVASTSQPPVVTGDPSTSATLVREGLSITGNVATFSGATTTTYQWRRCDSRGFNCIDISGATGTTHTMTAADAAGDRTLRFEQIATNANGTSIAVSQDTTTVQSIPPANTVRPAISGATQSGSKLTTTNGTWTSSSPLSYTYRWRRCTGGACVNISGANASTYTLTDSDVGSTVDVIVSATNTGGATDANADATSTIAAAPVVSSGGGSSGGSGGTSGGSSGGTSGGSSGGSGGAGSPDLVVAASASNSNPAVGDTVLVFVTVTDANLKPAQGLYVNMTFDSGLQFVSSTADRGSGCTASSTTTLKCFLDWLSSDVSVGRFQVALKVGASGQHTVSATATSQQAVLTAAHSTTTLTLDQTPSSSSSSSSSGSTSGVPNGLSGSVPTVTKKKDKTRPTINALSSVGRRGRTANLRYRIHDDSGVAKALATVRRGRVVVATMSTGFGPVASEGVYYSGWHVPAKAKKGTYSFCLTAVDRAGNKSARSCAPLAVK